MPASGVTKPQATLNSVVLPAPLGPITPMHLARRRPSRPTSSRAVIPPKVTVTSRELELGGADRAAHPRTFRSMVTRPHHFGRSAQPSALGAEHKIRWRRRRDPSARGWSGLCAECERGAMRPESGSEARFAPIEQVTGRPGALLVDQSRRDRGRHHAHPVRAGRGDLRADRARAARRRPGEHAAAHPARPAGPGRVRARSPSSARDAVARDRAPPRPAGRPAGAGAQRLHARRPDALGGARDPRPGGRGRDRRPGPARRAAKTVWSNLDVQNAVLIDAYRRESARLHRQDLQRQQTLLDALLEGRGADPEFADEARAALDIGADDAIACVVALLRRLPGRARSPRPRTAWTGSASRRAGTCGPGSTSGCCRARCPTSRAWWRCSRRTHPAGWAWRRRRDGIAGFATGLPARHPGGGDPAPRRAACGLGGRAAAGGAARRQPAGRAAAARRRPWDRCWASRSHRPARCWRRWPRCCATTGRPRTRPRSCTATATP